MTDYRKLANEVLSKTDLQYIVRAVQYLEIVEAVAIAFESELQRREEVVRASTDAFNKMLKYDKEMSLTQATIFFEWMRAVDAYLKASDAGEKKGGGS